MAIKGRCCVLVTKPRAILCLIDRKHPRSWYGFGTFRESIRCRGPQNFLVHILHPTLTKRDIPGDGDKGWNLGTGRGGSLWGSKLASLSGGAGVVQHCNLQVVKTLAFLFKTMQRCHRNIRKTTFAFSPKWVCQWALEWVLPGRRCPSLPCTQYSRLRNVV